ncbi:MAG: hypothetical protein ACXWF6_08865 [Usitatibacter sp.]
MMNFRLAPLLLLAALPVRAADFPSIGALAQDEFHRISQDLGAAFSYKGVTPATALGITGIDVGIEVSETKMENSQLFARAGAGDQSRLIVPKLHVHKGLFGGLDIGAFAAAAPDVSASLFGAELRYAVADDGLATPAVGVRLSGTRAGGLGDLKVNTAALDLVVSKKFTAITPYAGAGTVRVQSSVNGSALREERFNKGRVFGGVNVNLLAVNLAFEAEKMGDNTSLSAKIGWRF